jgi:DNA-binding NarL/FixJ family response regulator
MGQLLKVFLVEDSAEIRAAIEHNLKSMGGIELVGYADNAPSAIHALQTLEIDALVVDLNLREGSGLHVLSHLQQQGNPKSILRIVLTNHATPAFKKACEGLSVDHFFDKSLEFDRAIEVLKTRASPFMRGKDPAG